MAENEYLDASKARRWQSVAQAICEGRSESEVTELVEDCLYRTLRPILKDLPFGDLIRSLTGRGQLQELCDQIEGAHDVKDFLMEAADHSRDRRSQLLHFLQSSLDNCLYDVPWLAADLSNQVNITDARRIAQYAKSSLQPELRRIADKLAANPDWALRRANRKTTSASKTTSTERMLRESLLAGFRK